MISEYVREDPTSIHSYEDFENGVKEVKEFILARSDSIQKQLWGLSPRVKENNVLEQDLNDFNDIEILLGE